MNRSILGNCHVKMCGNYYPDNFFERQSDSCNLLGKNGYPTKSINKHMNGMKRRPNISTVPQRVLFLKLKFLNDATEEIVTQSLRKVVQRTFTVA